MAKKGRKKIPGEKKIPKVQQLKLKEKKSKRNSWITSLIAILVVVALSVFWIVSNNANKTGKKFVGKFDAFTCVIPNNWTTYDLNDTIKFESWLGESSYPHLFTPKTVDIGSSESIAETPTLQVSPEFLEALQKNQGGKASEEVNRELTKQLQAQAGDRKIGAPEIDPNLTALTVAIFNEEKSDSDIRKYINGIGGILNPVEHYLTKLELEGEKIPGVEYGYYKLYGGNHPTGIIKTGIHTIVFNGIISEGYVEDFKTIIESFEVP